MAYACPVCGSVEADAEHLANHLAVTAALHSADHADWLDDHVPDWPDRTPGELGADVVDHAERRDVEGSTVEHDRDVPSRARPSDVTSGGRGSDGGRIERDPETERILREAREMTERSGDDRAEDGSTRAENESTDE